MTNEKKTYKNVMELLVDEEIEYTIVGSTEADPDDDKISNASPIGNGLIGHVVGDVVEIDVPVGTIKYKVLNIRKA